MQSIIKRKSGVELLRIIAVVLIVLSHSVQTMQNYIDYSIPTSDVLLIVMKLLRKSGQIGNIIFIICSSWFLVNNAGGGFKPKKAISILLDSSFISIVIVIAMRLFTNISFTWHDYLTQILPDIFQNMWFVPVYVLFYCVSPLLNESLKVLNKKSHLAFCIISMILYGYLGIFGLKPVYSELLGFVLTYYLVAYMKMHMSKFYSNKKINIIFFVLLLVLYYSIHIYKNYNAYSNFYLLKFASKNGVHIFDFFTNFDNFFNPILTPMLMCLFNIFNNINITSNKINSLASCSLFVYCIHENILLRTYIRTAYYEYMLNNYGYDNYFLIMLSCFFGMLICGFILALIYKNSLHKLSILISEKLEILLNKFLDKASLFMERFE